MKKKQMFDVRLRDGSRIRLRPIRRTDAPLMIDLFHRFSRDTIHQRFFEEIRDMTRKDLEFYLDVDYKKKFALVAEIPGKKKLVGVARYAGSGEEAEFSIVIADEWQNRGLGGKMFGHLIEIARDNGMKRLVGFVFRNNSRMIHMVERTKLPFTVTPVDEETLKYELAV